jgi:tryptophan-rich sensory protein
VAIYTRPLRRELDLPLTARIEARAGTRPQHAAIVTPRLLKALSIVAIYASSAAITARYVETGPGTWFDAQPKPDYVRTEWLFGQVELAVLMLLATSAWLVWRRDWPEPERRRALAMLGVQLAIVSVWAPVLFGAHAVDLAVLLAAAMWLASLAVLTTLAPANVWAAMLAAPMLAWATYAIGVSVVLALNT